MVANIGVSQWARFPILLGRRFHLKLPNTKKGAFLPRLLGVLDMHPLGECRSSIIPGAPSVTDRFQASRKSAVISNVEAQCRLVRSLNPKPGLFRMSKLKWY